MLNKKSDDINVKGKRVLCDVSLVPLDGSRITDVKTL